MRNKIRQIVRVEHTDGTGMFKDAFHRRHSVQNILPYLNERHQRFNNPAEDGLGRTDTDFCAYKSIEHIQKWIMPDEFKVLFENGYSVYLLEVSEYQEGRDNILFKKENVVSKKDISQLFHLQN